MSAVIGSLETLSRLETVSRQHFYCLGLGLSLEPHCLSLGLEPHCLGLGLGCYCFGLVPRRDIKTVINCNVVVDSCDPNFA
jgi:hypothetical protein